MTNFVSCPICNKQLQRITNSHLRVHEHTFESFAMAFPAAVLETPNLKKTYGSQSKETRKKIKQTKHFQKQLRETIYYKTPSLCKQCKSVIPYESRTNEFCNRSCRAKLVNITRVISQKGKNNIRKSAKLNKARLMHYTNLRKEQHPPFTSIFFKLCTICNVPFVARRETTQTCSPTCKAQLHSKNNFRQNKTRGKCGFFENVWCASSWELAFVAYNQAKGITVKRYPSSIVYTQNNKQKRYFPDFIIADIVYEIKGRLTDDVPIKLEAARHAGLNIVLLTKDDILPMIRFVKSQYQITDITQLYGVGRENRTPR